MQQACKIMGILNVTPDSFSDGGRFVKKVMSHESWVMSEEAVARALKMVEEGADIIDVGGESSRPGSEPVSVEEELRRVVPVIRALREKLQARAKEKNLPQAGVEVSIDTTKSIVAAQAVEAGATMINDISAGRFDPEMFSVAASTQATICLMHMLGTPKTMQQSPYYEDVVAEVKDFLRERIASAQAAGIAREKIWIDPGIGFGKRVEDNLALLHGLDQFLDLGCPVLIGASRKSFIGALTGAPVENRLPGSLAAAASAIRNGAQILRVHDVAATRQFLTLLLF